MSTSVDTTPVLQRTGGIAALYLAAAFLLAMPYFLVVVDYPGATDAAEKVALLASNHASMHVVYLITYVIFGVVLNVLALALYARLRPAAPALMVAATAVGFIWSVALVASGLVFNAGMAAVIGVYPTNPHQAVSMWQAIEPVAQGLGSGTGGELLGGLWVLLVSVATLRSTSLPRSLGWLGLVVGLAGVLSVVPPLNPAAYAFGLILIVWFVWLGIAMIRSGTGSAQQIAGPPETAGASAGMYRR